MVAMRVGVCVCVCVCVCGLLCVVCLWCVWVLVCVCVLSDIISTAHHAARCCALKTPPQADCPRFCSNWLVCSWHCLNRVQMHTHTHAITPVIASQINMT